MASGGDDKVAGKGGGRNGDDKVAGKGVSPQGAAFQGGAGSPFRGGCGWAVVAFIGPVGLDVSQLAANMLGAGYSQVSSGHGPQEKALHNLAAEAVTKARERAQELKVQESDAKEYRALKAVQYSGQPPRLQSLRKRPGRSVKKKKSAQ
jgi:hypothetical protein